ncbi:MAG: pyridoxal phosphate-dependent aminotransferase [Candidatus Thermoplasmatota archaeon]
MKQHSLYLSWYTNQKNLVYDLRSSGITTCPINLQHLSFDLGVNYHHGNPETLKILSKRYHTNPRNIFLSSDGTSGQNTRIIRYLAEKYPKKNEAIIEYPTYEPLLRLLQEYYPTVHQIRRVPDENYRLDLDELEKKISKKTGLLVLTNPHAPSAAVFSKNEIRKIMTLAGSYNFYVLCDEIYAEFNRETFPTIFLHDKEHAIVTTSFTKAYGLGGLKLGIVLAHHTLVDELYQDALFSVGNSSNLVEYLTAELFTKYHQKLENLMKKYFSLKRVVEEWLIDQNMLFYPNRYGLTYWIKTSIPDTYTWVQTYAIPRMRLAVVPGSFFLFKKDYTLYATPMIRLGLGKINPESSELIKALQMLERAAHQK